MINVAVIGTGNMGRNHVRVYSEIDDVNLVAVSDINENTGKKISQKFKCQYYKDYKEMISKEKIDAVSIAVPTGHHEGVALECLKHNIHVLIEKPITDTIDKGERLWQKAREYGVLLMVGHIERYNPAVIALKKIMDEGRLGKIISIVAKRVGVFPPQIKDANVILDLGIHDLDLFNYMLGKEPREVYTKGGTALGSEREDHALIMLDYGDVSCFAQTNWITPVKIRNLAVTGTKGYAELNYITQELNIFESVYEKTHDSFGDFILEFGTPNEIKLSVKKEEPLKLEIKNFINAVQGKSAPLVTGDDGIKALKIALKSIESYRKGYPITLG
ncbi:MAG TPA: Gfo/Idh/MocA family oxidoreductase [Euryarchaeota archaeon]|nr:inositol 2-dehydrogenase [archaeon BMS3Bbin15]HDL14867.1 Gfo/Idh/MocA family oxidoreductase [Euryarchaeota archaeon]